MGRPPAFDQETALGAALETFWSQGFGASSVQVLLDAMQLHRGSLYNSFGSKEELFRRALDLYFERNASLVIALLDDSENPVEGLYGVFEWTLVGLPEDLRRRGCLLVNSVAELGQVEPDLARHAWAHLDKVRQAMGRALERARAAGLWRAPTMDSAATADLLFHYLTGLRVSTRLVLDPEQVRSGAKSTLELVGLDTTGIRR